MNKVMIVDDDESLRKTVRRILESESFEVVETINYYDCWEKIQKDPPKLILLDIMMPGESFNLVQKINSDLKLKSIKIVYITALGGVKERAVGTGVITTIEKPFKRKELVAVVKKILK
ncbi:MAG: response regulator [Nanoarchaeota archaeon]|nr:response regulator [Nanoarchaeota archaeon]